MRISRMLSAFVAAVVVCVLTGCAQGGSSSQMLPRVSSISAADHAFAAPHANFTEFVLPAGQIPTSVAVGDDGNAWVLTDRAVDRVTLTGDVTTFEAPRGSHLAGSGIVSGSDGALWFLGLQLPIVQHDRPANGITVYRLTSAGALSSRIACFGCDSYPGDVFAAAGRVRFTSEGSFACGLVGSISVAGVLGPQDDADLCQPTSVVEGPDGAVYVTVADRFATDAAVFRLSPSSIVLNKYELAPTSNPESITVGPDHRLWMTLVGQNAIAAMTTSGKFSFYPLPTPHAFSPSGDFEFSGAQTARIVSGRGALWFVENNANKIGRISVSGKITEYAIPRPDSSPSGLAVCSKGCGRNETRVWFTESGAGRLASLSISQTQ